MILRLACALSLTVWLCAAPSWATITLVQKAPNTTLPTEVGGVTTINLVFGSTPTAGDSITVNISVFDTGVTVSSVTDSQSGTYTCVSKAVAGGTTGLAASCYRLSIGSGTAITVTVTLSGAAFASAGAIQWHSDVSTLAFDSSVTASCSASCTSAVSAGSLNPLGTALYTGVLMSPSSVTSWTVGSGYTAIHNQPSAGTCCAHLSQWKTTTGSQTYNATLGTSGVNWAAVGIALREVPPTITGCRLLQNGVDKRLQQSGSPNGRIFQGGGSCGLGGGGATVVPANMLLGVGL